MEAPHGEQEGLIKPILRFLSRNSCKVYSSRGEREYIGSNRVFSFFNLDQKVEGAVLRQLFGPMLTKHVNILVVVRRDVAKVQVLIINLS